MQSRRRRRSGQSQGRTHGSFVCLKSVTVESLTVRMGGLLIADAARDIARNTRKDDPMWPHVVGVLGEYMPERE